MKAGGLDSTVPAGDVTQISRACDRCDRSLAGDDSARREEINGGGEWMFCPREGDLDCLEGPAMGASISGTSSLASQISSIVASSVGGTVFFGLLSLLELAKNLLFVISF